MNYARIGVLGDTHGNTQTMRASLRAFHDEGITHILHLGDFGFSVGKRNMLFLDVLQGLMEKYGQTMYVTPGNHENYDYLNSLVVHDDGWQYARSNIRVAPRGHRWEWEGVSFVSLGGAPSVDRQWRLQDMSQFPGERLWWADEVIRPEDVERTVAGGHADVMVAHDVPFGSPKIEEYIRPNPVGFPKIDLDYAYEGRQLMRKAFNGVQPKLFMHGHYHIFTDVTWNVPSAPMTRDIQFTTRMISFAGDMKHYALGELRLPSLEVTPWRRL